MPTSQKNKCRNIGQIGKIHDGLTDGTPQNTAACAKLTADISLNDTTDWRAWTQDTEGLKFWTPISWRSYDLYTGVFDGQNHVVSGLYISDKTQKFAYLGLFGYIKGN
jgi:hypothetical protein